MQENPPITEPRELSEPQKENLEKLFSKFVLLDNKELKGVEAEELAEAVKSDFLKILPRFIDQNKLDEIEAIKDKKELVKRYVEEISNTDVGWGFTPKLAIDNNEGVHGLDCTGATIMLAAVCEKHHMPVVVGRLVSHAVVLLDIGSETYYADPRNNIFFEIGTKPEIFEGYKLYKFSPEEQEKTQSNYSLLGTTDINDFIGNSIIGNLVELKKLSLDQENDIGPEDIKGANAIVEQYKEVLVKDDWEEMYHLLYPDIDNYIKDNEGLWEQEASQVSRFFEIMAMEEKLETVINETRLGLGYSEIDMSGKYSEIIGVLKENISEVSKFLGSGDEVQLSFGGIGADYIVELKKQLKRLDLKDREFVVKKVIDRLTI